MTSNNVDIYKQAIVIMLLSLSSLGNAKGQVIDSLCNEGCKKKGYLLFILGKEWEEIVFLSDNNASKKYNFDKIQKLIGKQLRGQDNYAVYKAKIRSQKFNVMLPIVNKKNDSAYLIKIELGIMPVEIAYKTYKSELPDRDTGIPFIYKGRHYVINYVDDWDVSIKDIKYIK